MAFKRITVVLSFSCVLFAISQVPSAAGTKKKPTKSDPALPAVEKALRAEVAGAVDRRVQLAETLKEHPDSAGARWQAGFVKVGDAWRSFDDRQQNTASAAVLDEYRRRRDEAPPSFPGQWDLADWCRKQGLKDQERVHLLVALTLAAEADRPKLLELLGYQAIGNQWLSREERRLAWQQLNRRIEGAIQNLGPRLEKIADRIDGSKRQHDAAVASLAKLTDPDAIPAIQYIFSGRNEACAESAVDACAKLESCEATVALAQAALFSKWPENRRRTTSLLMNRRVDDFVPALINLLASRFAVTTKTQFLVLRDAWGPGTAQFALLVNSIIARETDDQFQVATFHLADFRLNDILQGHVVSLDLGPVMIDVFNQPKIAQNRRSAIKKFDADLSDAAEALRRGRVLEEMNERTDELNRRVISVLAGATGRAPDSEPAAWWNWWADYSDLQQAGTKPVVVVSEDSEIRGDPTQRLMRNTCFAAGTLVWSEAGSQSIETIKVGDRVLAKDVETGELAYKSVLRTTVRPPKELTTVRFGDETIVCTGGHRFWSSGPGWIKARDLAPQTLLHTVTGNTPVWSAKKGNTAETYNLVVADFHTYFVGKTGVLSQDLLIPHSTNSIVPGLAQK